MKLPCQPAFLGLCVICWTLSRMWNKLKQLWQHYHKFLFPTPWVWLSHPIKRSWTLRRPWEDTGCSCWSAHYLKINTLVYRQQQGCVIPPLLPTSQASSSNQLACIISPLMQGFKSSTTDGLEIGRSATYIYWNALIAFLRVWDTKMLQKVESIFKATGMLHGVPANGASHRKL